MNYKFIRGDKLYQKYHEPPVVASHRLRMHYTIKFLKERGYDADYLKDNDDENTIYIIGTTKGNEIEKVKNKNFIFDMCDNEFLYEGNRQKVALHYCFHSKAITVCSEYLYRIVKDVLNQLNLQKPVYIMEDYLNFNSHKPHFEPKETLNILWYGDTFNFQYADWKNLVFDPLNNSDIKYNFKFMSNKMAVPIGSTNFEVVMNNPYSMDFHKQEVLKSDVILLCINEKHPAVMTKGFNKLSDGLILGKPVFASPQPSYLEFSDYAFIGNNFVDNIKYAIKNPKEVLEKISNGQKYIENNYSNEKITNKWTDALNLIKERSN